MSNKDRPINKSLLPKKGGSIKKEIPKKAESPTPPADKQKAKEEPKKVSKPVEKKKHTSIRINATVHKAAIIHCVTNDLVFADYVESLIKKDLKLK